MVIRVTMLAFAAIFLAAKVSAQRISREEYILKYKDIAIQHMERYGIPASIKIAQGILESDSGNSRLAREANNHFGIKCNSWRGETITHHDDARNECFRKYDEAERSFADHSEFLDSSPRYDALFKLRPDDYRGWAHGLREAGYATNPSYAQLLITIIEENNLYLLDSGVDVTDRDIRRRLKDVTTNETMPRIDIDNLRTTIDRATGRRTGTNNGAAYIIARDGDTFTSVASDYGMRVKRLLKYNDLAGEVRLSDGDILYIGRKAKRAENGRLLHIVEEGDTMYSISQKFGIRLKNLYRINNMAVGGTIHPGLQIKLK